MITLSFFALAADFIFFIWLASGLASGWFEKYLGAENEHVAKSNPGDDELESEWDQAA